MKLLTDTPKNPHLLKVEVDTENNLPVIEQKYSLLLSHFNQLQDIKDLFDKLGCLLIVGAIELECDISSKLKILKSLIDNRLTIDDEKILSLENLLLKYKEWIDQNSNTLTPCELRHATRKNILNLTDLVAFAGYLTSKDSENIDEHGKLEIVFSEICRNTNYIEKQTILKKLFPRETPITPETKATIEELYSLADDIETITEFPTLIDSGYLCKERYLKLALGSELKHPLALVAIGTINLGIRTRFYNLFNIEKYFIEIVCKRLLLANINRIELDDNSILEVEKTLHFLKDLEKLLEQDYYLNMELLHKFASTGLLMRKVSKKLEEHNQSLQTSLIFPIQKVSTYKPMLEPISTTSHNVLVEDIESHLGARIDEIRELIKSYPNPGEIYNIGLKHGFLHLNKWEVERICSSGDMVIDRKYLYYNMLVRRSIAIMAELEETATIFAENIEKKISKYLYSLSTIVYLLKENRIVIDKLKNYSQKEYKYKEIDLSLNMLALSNKLGMSFEENWKIIIKLFPTIKLEDLIFYTPTSNLGKDSNIFLPPIDLLNNQELILSQSIQP